MDDAFLEEMEPEDEGRLVEPARLLRIARMISPGQQPRLLEAGLAEGVNRVEPPGPSLVSDQRPLVARQRGSLGITRRLDEMLEQWQLSR